MYSSQNFCISSISICFINAMMPMITDLSYVSIAMALFTLVGPIFIILPRTPQPYVMAPCLCVCVQLHCIMKCPNAKLKLLLFFFFTLESLAKLPLLGLQQTCFGVYEAVRSHVISLSWIGNTWRKCSYNCHPLECRVKTRRHTYDAAVYAHINTASFFCHTVVQQ